MTKLSIIGLILSAALVSTSAWAQQEAKTEARDSDKLDIRKLEQKYWSAKDDDFSVVQNRRYVKASRFYLTGSAGIPFNDPYSTGSIMGASLGYFLNERWGFELNYNSASLSDNDAVKQFVDTYGAIPNHNVYKSSYYLSGIWVPFYAKMSFIDRAIIYFDMGLSVGAGTLNYDITQNEGPISKSTFGYKLGIFQQIFFSEHWAIRMDLINTWSSQEKLKYYAPGGTTGGGQVTDTTPRDLGSETVNDTSLMLGVTFWY